MKKHLVFFLIISILLFSSCAKTDNSYDIIATTLPVYDFTSMLCDGTDLSVGRLITESVSCLHDYTLKVSQMRMIEESGMIIISGAGLEDFLDDALNSSQLVIDASVNTHIHTGSHHHEETDHSHSHDPHIWLSTENASEMVKTICKALTERYPEYAEIFERNLDITLEKLLQLQTYGHAQLSNISCRELITFHDGFAYFAESFDLRILKAIEEESGSEASAKEIIELVQLIDEHNLQAVFTEKNGSTACAEIVSAESGIPIYTLDMAMSGDSYFDAMYYNIDTIKESLK